MAERNTHLFRIINSYSTLKKGNKILQQKHSTTSPKDHMQIWSEEHIQQIVNTQRDLETKTQSPNK